MPAPSASPSASRTASHLDCLHACLAMPMACFAPDLASTPDPTHAATRSLFTLIEHDAATRGHAERFIRARFAESYAAQVEQFMPRLFTLRDALGNTVGAFGLRDADSAPLFLERYLDTPVEDAVAAALAAPVARAQIVEVGQFAGLGAGAFRAMIVQLTAWLHRHGFRWVVFTGTASLRNAFGRLGLAPTDIVAADPTRLSEEERLQWGRYYEHAPHVLCGDIAQGFAALERAAARVQEAQA